jgi:hypothetical protein
MKQRPEVRVGIIDGLVSPNMINPDNIILQKEFIKLRTGTYDCELPSHADLVASLILESAPAAKLVFCSIFRRESFASVSTVVEALRWLAEFDLDVINLSFGTNVYSKELEDSCLSLSSYGSVLICSSPARGKIVYPAAFDCCIAVSGDARCSPGQISFLGTELADFGTHPFVQIGSPKAGGGASFATARFSGLASELIAVGCSRESIREELKSRCAFYGPEHKSVATK